MFYRNLISMTLALAIFFTSGLPAFAGGFLIGSQDCSGGQQGFVFIYSDGSREDHCWSMPNVGGNTSDSVSYSVSTTTSCVNGSCVTSQTSTQNNNQSTNNNVNINEVVVNGADGRNGESVTIDLDLSDYPPASDSTTTPPAGGQMLGLARGTQIRTGPGFGYPSTIPAQWGSAVPEDNWLVVVRGGPVCREGWEWLDVDRGAAGDPHGGTGWAAIRPCSSSSNQTSTTPESTNGTTTPNNQRRTVPTAAYSLVDEGALIKGSQDVESQKEETK